MRWFADLAIGRKLALGFGTLAVLMAVVGGQGVWSARTLDQTVDRLYVVHAKPALNLKEANVDLLRISRAVRNAILDDDATAVAQRTASIAQYDSAFRKEFELYRAEIVKAEQKQMASDLLALYDRLRPGQDAIVQLAASGKDVEAKAGLGAIRLQSDSIDTYMDVLIGSKVALMEQAAVDSDREYRRSSILLIGLLVAAIVIAIGAAVSITRPIVRGLSALGQTADALALGDVQQQVDIASKDEMGMLALSMQRMIAAQKELAAAATAISAGDMSVSLTARGPKDAVGHAFIQLRDTVQSLVAETGTLVSAATSGVLSTRGDADHFTGAYRDLVRGINNTLDAVVTPINEASAVMVRIADRDMTARVTGDYQGDFATIKHSINTAAETLDEALSQVHVAAEQVASAGQEIASGSQALAQGSSEQAASLEEVASSLQEMSSSTAETAVNARQARDMALGARERVTQGRASMERLSTAIDSIKTSSDQTARIVKTIDEIAFQTNLLALNAAVEAARAGDAGRGFAVVADEVRSLAIRSAEAAKNTALLIEEAVRNAAHGVTYNAEVLAKLGEIDADVQKVGSVVADIALAGERQRDGVAQINVAVEQLNSVTQQVAANAEESASASEELAGQSITLTTLVGSFGLSSKTSERGRPRPMAPASRGRRGQAASLTRRGAAANTRSAQSYDESHDLSEDDVLVHF